MMVSIYRTLVSGRTYSWCLILTGGGGRGGRLWGSSKTLDRWHTHVMSSTHASLPAQLNNLLSTTVKLGNHVNWHYLILISLLYDINTDVSF